MSTATAVIQFGHSRGKPYLRNCVIAVMLASSVFAQSMPNRKSAVVMDVLPPEQQDIYRVFLTHLPNTECPSCWNGKKKYLVSVAQGVTTISSDSDQCLAGLSLVSNPAPATYRMPSSAIMGLDVSLITEEQFGAIEKKWRKKRKPAAIIYQVSGVVFTNDHNVAAFHYSLNSASWQNSGVAIVERSGSQWKLDIQRTLIRCRSRVVE